MTHIDATEPPPAPGDILLLRVIYLVSAIGLLALAGIIALALFDRTAPDVLDNIATGALVGLTGLLAARRT